MYIKKIKVTQGIQFKVVCFVCCSNYNINFDQTILEYTIDYCVKIAKTGIIKPVANFQTIFLFLKFIFFFFLLKEKLIYNLFTYIIMQ